LQARFRRAAYTRVERQGLIFSAVATVDYGEVPIWQHAAAKLPWGHNQLLLDKIGDPNLRNWYAEAAANAGWKRSVLLHQIETRLHERQGKAITNFDRNFW
jgi:hypothetical protein